MPGDARGHVALAYSRMPREHDAAPVVQYPLDLGDLVPAGDAARLVLRDRFVLEGAVLTGSHIAPKR